MVAVILPSGDYKSEGALLRALETYPEVKSAMGLANIEAMDGYVLTSALNPREFSELAGIEYELSNLLYSAYAVNDDQYGQIINGLDNYQVPLFDMFLFLKDQMEREISLWRAISRIRWMTCSISLKSQAAAQNRRAQPNGRVLKSAGGKPGNL